MAMPERNTFIPQEREKTPTEVAEQRLGEIWKEYFSGQRNRTTQDAHNARIKAFMSGITPEVGDYLEQEVTVNGEPITRGRLIQHNAKMEVITEKAAQNNGLEKSTGARQQTRSQKAFQRRGIPQNRIH